MMKKTRNAHGFSALFRVQDLLDISEGGRYTHLGGFPFVPKKTSSISFVCIFQGAQRNKPECWIHALDAQTALKQWLKTLNTAPPEYAILHYDGAFEPDSIQFERAE